MRNRVFFCLLAASLLAGGFVWGFFVHRDSVFPHSLLVRLGLASGILKPVQVKATGGSERATLAGHSYVDGTFDEQAAENGVVLHREGEVSPGLNFYGSRNSASCRLIDMSGKIIHEWAWPSGTWEHTELLPNGDVLATILDNRMIRLDADSNLLWTLTGRFHHDLDVLNDGTILALVREAVVLPEVHPTHRTLDDRLVFVSASGERGREVSLTRLLLDSSYEFLVPSVSHLQLEEPEDRPLELDILHTNHVEVLDGRLAELSPLFAAGNVMISMRNINTIAILNAEMDKVIWVWGASNLTYQHHPRLLANGHILLFDNGKEESRVLEVDPLSRQIVWEYENGRRFFSATRGSVQRLPNGNTLITESDRGYAFEVTPKGETVWRFANPEILPGDIRCAIWRMTRFSLKELPFLEAVDGE